LEITRHDQLAKQQQLYQQLREVQDILSREEETFLTQSQELESLTMKRKTKVEELANYIQRKSELLSSRDELMAIDQENMTKVSNLKEKLGELNVSILSPSLPPPPPHTH
jgi:uncharacterized protein YciW